MIDLDYNTQVSMIFVDYFYLNIALRLLEVWTWLSLPIIGPSSLETDYLTVTM
jgi:hypothetical protein